MGNKASRENYEMLVKKAAMFDIVCALVESGKGYMVCDIVMAVEGGAKDGSSDCTES